MHYIVTKGKIARTEFDKFDIVFNGHHHDYEHIENIVVVGPPYHVNFGDVGKKRGFAVFDTKTKEYSFEIYNKYPFIKLDTEREINFDKVKNYFVRLEWDRNKVEESAILKAKKILSENNFHVDVEHKKKNATKEEVKIEINTFDDAYKEYLNKMAKDLNIKRLNEIYQDIKTSADD